MVRRPGLPRKPPRCRDYAAFTPTPPSQPTAPTNTDTDANLFALRPFHLLYPP